MLDHDARRHELLRRHRRDAIQEMVMLDADEFWHPLSAEAYRDVLYATLEEIEAELEGEEYWREDYE